MMSVFFLLLALVPTVFVYDGYVDREVKATGGSYRRDDDPVLYWAVMAVYAALLAYCLYFAVDVAYPINPSL